MNKFAFEIGQTVKIANSDEVGKVTGRAEYQNSENSYYLLYKAADGRAVEAWWTESALVAA